MIKFCPRCNRRFSVQSTDTDFVHECDSGNATLDNEDIVRLDVANAMSQGGASSNWGTRSWIEGHRDQAITSRGNRTSTHTTRKHQEYIKLKKEEC